MVFLPNLGVNRRSRLCDVASYVSAQELDFLDLEQKSSSVNWKHQKVPWSPFLILSARSGKPTGKFMGEMVLQRYWI